MGFSDLKKNRSKSLEKLSSQLDKMASKTYADPLAEKYWTPTKDAAGNGFAVIRFLPAPNNEDMPFVRVWDHGFQGPGGWYIEKSLTTLDLDDPASKYNSQLWNTGIDSNKEIVRKQKRRLKYHSNILVIKDSAKPENEGKVFLYAYGKKIFDKLNDLMNPQFEDETPVNPFDFWLGADFKLKIRVVEGYPNYDKSEFDDPSALMEGDDDKLEKIFNEIHSLQELIDPKNFKTYADLEARLHKALGITADANLSRGSNDKAEDLVEEELDMSKLGAKTSDAKVQKSADAEDSKSASVDEDDDDEMAFFHKLAK